MYGSVNEPLQDRSQHLLSKVLSRMLRFWSQWKAISHVLGFASLSPFLSGKNIPWALGLLLWHEVLFSRIPVMRLGYAAHLGDLISIYVHRTCWSVLNQF